MKKQEIKKQKNSIEISKEKLEQLLKKQEEEILTKLSIQTTQIRQAPTPSPEELKQLKQIDSSLPDRIIAMAEKEQNFRHKAIYFGQLNFILLVTIGYGIAAIKTHQPKPPKQIKKDKYD